MMTYETAGDVFCCMHYKFTICCLLATGRELEGKPRDMDVTLESQKIALLLIVRIYLSSSNALIFFP
jgi:hypothetical protein